MRTASQPGSRTGTEKPKPGSEGATTWKTSAGRPPYALGSASGPRTPRNSTKLLGYPWVTTSGRASGSGERTCAKWTAWPSMVVMYWGSSLSLASAARQSKPSRQYSASAFR